MPDAAAPPDLATLAEEAAAASARRRRGRNAAELVGPIYEHLRRVWDQYDPSSGPPGPWVARVAENRILSLERADPRRGRDGRPPREVSDATPAGSLADHRPVPGPDAWTPVENGDRLSDNDLARLRSEDRVTRVLVAAAFGLWRVAPEGFAALGGEWHEWLGELGAVDPAACDDALLAADTHRERVAVVAECAGLADNTAFQKYKRGRHRIAGLDWWWTVALPHVDHQDVFAVDDVARLREVSGERVGKDGPPADRLVLLCLGGAWNRFRTRSVFEELCRPNGLRRNFPWLTFLTERSFAARLAALAGRDALHRSERDLREMWSRTAAVRSELGVRGRRKPGESHD